jgi:tetratricopeptide (TPR) repeat protein
VRRLSHSYILPVKVIFLLSFELKLSMKPAIEEGEKMGINTFYKDKLASVIFIEVSKEAVKKVFKVSIDEDICIPVRSANLLNKVKDGYNFEAIPGDLMVEGMFFVLGSDPTFRYNNSYRKILNSIPKSTEFIKGIIYTQVKNELLEDAYIILKGLLELEENIENYDRIISLLENLRVKNKIFKDEEMDILKKAENLDGFIRPYVYEAVLLKEKGELESSLMALDTYLSKGGEETPEITELKCTLRSSINYEKGKELVYSEPEKGLKYLLPLMDEFGDDATLFYYVSICYRMLANHEKAIYYLNEAMSIDNDIVEVVNELGINYASLGDYEEAVRYFRKAFEVTKNVEICTNLIMCYLNMGNIDMARKHYDIALKLDPKDEVVQKLSDIMKNL